jgi:hypothetical protein
MRRRALVLLLGGMFTLARSLRAQQQKIVQVIGFLNGGSLNLNTAKALGLTIPQSSSAASMR